MIRSLNGEYVAVICVFEEIVCVGEIVYVVPLPDTMVVPDKNASPVRTAPAESEAGKGLNVSVVSEIPPLKVKTLTLNDT